MKKSMSPVITGLATGAIIGTAAYMMSNKASNSTAKVIKRNAGKALKTVGGIMENMSYMIK